MISFIRIDANPAPKILSLPDNWSPIISVFEAIVGLSSESETIFHVHTDTVDYPPSRQTFGNNVSSSVPSARTVRLVHRRDPGPRREREADSA